MCLTIDETNRIIQTHTNLITYLSASDSSYSMHLELLEMLFSYTYIYFDLLSKGKTKDRGKGPEGFRYLETKR